MTFDIHPERLLIKILHGDLDVDPLKENCPYLGGWGGGGRLKPQMKASFV